MPNVKKAKEFFEKASEAGLAIADHNLAILYFGGIGGECNREKALEYAHKAFSGGYLGEASFLCDAYLYGWGTEKNVEKAKEYNGYARYLGLQSAEYKYVEICHPDFYNSIKDIN